MAARLSLPPAKSPAFAKLVSSSRATFLARGWLHLPGFISAESSSAMVSEARRLLHDPSTSFRSSEGHTAYQLPHDPALPDSHPRNALQTSSKRISDYARLGADSELVKLYNEDSFMQFVSAVVEPLLKPQTDEERAEGKPLLHRSACPYNSAYYNAYEDGDGLGWHFDQSVFGVNLVLQPPSEGGHFDFHPGTRADGVTDDMAYDTVARIMGGDLEGVDCLDSAEAGSLVIFAGRRCLHRVSPVKGTVPRINAIVHFEAQPGQRLNAYSLRRFFGREVEA
jgi:hypothetical protein